MADAPELHYKASHVTSANNKMQFFYCTAEINTEEKVSASSKQGTEASKDRLDPTIPPPTIGSQARVGTDLDAAKVAAMKAAEFGSLFFLCINISPLSDVSVLVV